MDSDNTERNKFEVTTAPQEKNGLKCFEKKSMILVLVGVVVVLIIIAVSLGVVLSQGDDDGDTDSLTTSRFPIILISADGFRSDYLSQDLTPNILKLGNDGVRAKFMLSQFPTKTFPNHYTIVTGLYPESHGIVFNSFYDPVLRRRFSIQASRNPIFWDGGEPIWITANKTGLKSAAFYWVGSEVEGIRTTYYRNYNQSVPFSHRVKQVLKWLQLPEEERPSIIMLYFHEPDYAGHGFGTNSSAVRKQIRLVDDSIGQLMTGLKDMNKSDEVDVILLSDHGMSSVNCSNVIFLDKYGVNDSDLYISNAGSVLTFNTKRRSNLQKVFNMIKCRNDSFQPFYKSDLPKRMHFSNNRRIDDVIVLADQRELLSVDSTAQRRRCASGEHGYDNILPDMRTIFMAKGPSFQKRKVVEHFSNIEIYNLLAGLLKIKPAPNNGTVGSLNKLLVPEAKLPVSRSHDDGTVFRTDICKFPNDVEFESRSKCCSCSSCNVSQDNIIKANKILDISAEKAKFYQEELSPWGLPEGGVGKESCVLTQPNFITGYSTYLRIPLWTVSALDGNKISQSDKIEDCFRNDVRLLKNQSVTCSSYNNTVFVKGQLVASRDISFNKPTMLSGSIFSNIVPTYPIFKKGIWERLENMIRSWAIKYRLLHVISGTIFDVDGDGIKDKEITTKRRVGQLPQNPVIPTHFYKIVTRCETETPSEYNLKKCDGTLRVISFILQHKNEHCEFHSYEKLLLQNVAPVKDIELLTGSNFFSELPQQLQVELKTFVPVQLWS